MKNCTHCHIVKPNSEFYRRGNGRLLSWCKTCTGLQLRAWHVANEERRRLTHRMNLREQRLRHPERSAAINKRWRNKNMHRKRIINKAGEAVRRALARGVLTRSNACGQCGAIGIVIEAAHLDYQKPLDVLWLCRSCHRIFDREQPKTLSLAPLGSTPPCRGLRVGETEGI